MTSSLLDRIQEEELPYIPYSTSKRVLPVKQPIDAPFQFTPRQWAVARACHFLDVVKDPYLVNKKLLLNLEKKYPELSDRVNKVALHICGVEPLLRTTTSLVGPANSGKSLSAVCIARNMRDLFGQRVVVIGQSMGIQDSFGSYVFLSKAGFLQNLQRINFIVAMKEEHKLSQEQTEKLYVDQKVVIRRSVLLMDEPYGMLEAKDAGDKVVKLFSNFFMNYRHEFCTIIMMMPERETVTKRVRFQIGWTGYCKYHEAEQTGAVYFQRGRFETYRYLIYGPDYFGMYNTHEPVATRQKYLNISADEL